MSLGIILLNSFRVSAYRIFPSWGYSRSWGYRPSGGYFVLVWRCCSQGRLLTNDD